MEKYNVGFVTNDNTFDSIDISIEPDFGLEGNIVNIINVILNVREEKNIKLIQYIDYIMEDE